MKGMIRNDALKGAKRVRRDDPMRMIEIKGMIRNDALKGSKRMMRDDP